MGNKDICGILTVVQNEVMKPLVSLLGVVATFLFLWGAIEFIAGASDEKARSTGKLHMMWGIVGLVIMAVAWIIIKIFQSFFTNSVPGGPLCNIAF